MRDHNMASNFPNFRKHIGASLSVCMSCCLSAFCLSLVCHNSQLGAQRPQLANLAELNSWGVCPGTKLPFLRV